MIIYTHPVTSNLSTKNVITDTHTYTHTHVRTHSHTHMYMTYSEFQESWRMVASPLSIDHLCEQKLLQSLAVSKHAGVLELRSEGGNCAALGHSNLKNAQNYTKTSMVDCRDVDTLNMYVNTCCER